MRRLLNHNGISEAEELHTLQSLGLAVIWTIENQDGAMSMATGSDTGRRSGTRATLSSDVGRGTYFLRDLEGDALSDY